MFSIIKRGVLQKGASTLGSNNCGNPWAQ